MTVRRGPAVRGMPIRAESFAIHWIPSLLVPFEVEGTAAQTTPNIRCCLIDLMDDRHLIACCFSSVGGRFSLQKNQCTDHAKVNVIHWPALISDIMPCVLRYIWHRRDPTAASPNP